MKKNHSIFARAFIAASLSAVLNGASTAFAADEVQDIDLTQADIDYICHSEARPIQHIDTSVFAARSSDDFYQNNFGQRQFWLYGDTDHSDKRIHETFFSRQHIDYLASQNVKHIFIERAPSVSQKGIDDLVAGVITPKEFAQNYAGGGMWDRDGAFDVRIKVAEGMIYAANLGIAVHASDVKTKGIATKKEREELYGFYGNMSKEFNAMCPGAESITGAFYGYYQYKNRYYLAENNRGQRFREIMQERYNDTNRVTYIKSIAGNEKSAVLYGAAHLSGPKSIKSLLGEQNTIHINIFPESNKFDEYGLDDGDRVDFVYIVNRDRYYKVGDIDFAPLTTPKAGPKPVP